MYLLSPSVVLWVVIWSMVLFVVAPHLEVISKPAARTLRFGSVFPLVNIGATFAAVLGRFDGLFPVLGPVSALCTALFWGSFALAAWQILQAAPQKREL